MVNILLSGPTPLRLSAGFGAAMLPDDPGDV
jgi:hypothetical protein